MQEITTETATTTRTTNTW